MALSQFEELVGEVRQYEKARIQLQAQVPGEFVLNPEESIQFDTHPNSEQLINYYWKVRKLTAAVYYEQSVLDRAGDTSRRASDSKRKVLAGESTGGASALPGQAEPAAAASDIRAVAAEQKKKLLSSLSAKAKVAVQPTAAETKSQQESIAGQSAELYRQMIDEKYSGKAGVSSEQAEVIRKMELARGFQIEEMRRYDEIEALPDYKLVEYARVKAMDLYNRLAVGAITPDEFRKLLRGKIAKERGLDPGYFERPRPKRKISLDEEVRAFSEAESKGGNNKK